VFFSVGRRSPGALGGWKILTMLLELLGSFHTRGKSIIKIKGASYRAHRKWGNRGGHQGSKTVGREMFNRWADSLAPLSPNVRRHEKDTPVMRPVSSKPDQSARLVSLRRVGGLHHRYDWQDAA
jgi:hypothetical protein